MSRKFKTNIKEFITFTLIIEIKLYFTDAFKNQI